MADTFPSTSDDRDEIGPDQNDTRQKYRRLTPDEKEAMSRVKDAGQALIDEIRAVGSMPETEIALVRAQEAVMWAVRGITI